MAKLVSPGRDILDEAAGILPLVVAARSELEAKVAELGDEGVARHSVIASVQASLVRLTAELEDLA
jgi:hypothetical protein